MRGIRKWLPSAVLLAGCNAAWAQIPTEEPAIAAALPGGKIVGANRQAAPVTPAASMAGELPPSTTPAAAVPLSPPAPLVSTPLPAPVMQGLPASSPVNAFMPVGPLSEGISAQGNNCCGPTGANGPIGQEVYFRFGVTLPQGDSLLARNLKRGQTAQIGARTQLFDPSGNAAWAIDAHVVYAYNRGTNGDIITLEGEPVTVHALHRTSVGLGIGRDWFFWRPGFVLDTWDANFRLGGDIGGRWGAGHVDFDTPFEPGGYRRRYDVFGQAYGGVTGTMEIPFGGWIGMIGARVEADYTFSDLIPKDASFYQISVLGMFGVRY